MHKLRGHHLICLHFFKGYGYDEKFTENLRDVISKIKVVEVVEGIDDICKACPYNVGFCNYKESSEKEVKELDAFALDLLGLNIGEKVSWSYLKEKIPKTIEKWKFFACKNCDWRRVCDA